MQSMSKKLERAVFLLTVFSSVVVIFGTGTVSFNVEASEVKTASRQNAKPVGEFPKIHHFGPNCWNFALKNVNAMENYRAVSVHEFLHYVNSPYCKKIQEIENRRKGDIGSLILPGTGLTHSFVYLDETSAFAKGSPYVDQQIKKEDVAALKGIKAGRIVYQRCDFSNLDVVINSFLPDVNVQISKIESAIQRYLVTGAAIENEILRTFLKLLMKLRSARVEPAARQIAGFAPKALLYRTDSLIIQIFMLMNSSSANFELDTVNGIQSVIKENELRDRSAKTP
jgi:hypothetical protein